MGQVAKMNYFGAQSLWFDTEFPAFVSFVPFNMSTEAGHSFAPKGSALPGEHC